MSKNHNKSEFNKNEPKPTCNTCGVSKPFVLIRSQLTEAPGHRDQKMKPGYFEGIMKLHNALQENLYKNIDEVAEQFHSTLGNWLHSAPGERKKISPWLEGYYHWVGDIDGFCNSIVWGALEIHQPNLLKVMRHSSKEFFKHTDDVEKAHSNFLKTKAAPEIANKLIHSLKNNETGVLSGFRIHLYQLIGTTNKIHDPRLSTLLNDSVKGVRHEIESALKRYEPPAVKGVPHKIESALKRYEPPELSWALRKLKNDPRYVNPQPRHWAQNIPRGAYYTGIQLCGACGSEQNRSIDIKFGGNTCTQVSPNRGQNATKPLEYYGPVNELLIRIKPKLDEIWGEAFEELELRIEACNKLLKDAEKHHKHRLELQRKKERQAEISALEGRLKELKNED